MKYQMFYRIIFASLFGIIIRGAAGAPVNVDSLISAGNDLYLQRQYDRAAYYYERVINSGLASGDLYYNLGNTYYKLNQFAKAILYYEKALLLEPGDDDIRQNLAMANAQIIDKIEEIPAFFLKRWVRSVRGLLSPDEWAILSISLFTFSLLAFLIYYFGSRFTLKKVAFSSAVVAFVLFMGSFALMQSRTSHILKHDTGIIMQPSVNARSSPDDQSINVFVLHEGTKVEITDSVQQWHEIRLANGNNGWIPVSAIERI